MPFRKPVPDAVVTPPGREVSGQPCWNARLVASRRRKAASQAGEAVKEWSTVRSRLALSGRALWPALLGRWLLCQQGLLGVQPMALLESQWRTQCPCVGPLRERLISWAHLLWQLNDEPELVAVRHPMQLHTHLLALAGMLEGARQVCNLHAHLPAHERPELRSSAQVS